MSRILIIIFSFLIMISCNNSGPNNNISIKRKADSKAKPEFERGQDMSNPNNTLEDEIKVLELQYVAWGCACANWITDEDYEKYKDKKLSEHCIFIEPEKSNLQLPVTFDNFKNKFRVVGRFYENK